MRGIEIKNTGVIHYVDNPLDAIEYIREYLGDDMAEYLLKYLYVDGEVEEIEDEIVALEDEIVALEGATEVYRNAMFEAQSCIQQIVARTRINRQKLDEELMKINDDLNKVL